MANTVRAFFNFSFLASAGGELEIVSLGGDGDPFSVTLTSDVYRRERIHVPSETVTSVRASTGRSIIVPSVSGRLVWTLVDDTNNSSLNLRGGVPFYLPAQGVPYNATFLTMATGTPEDIHVVFFYQDSGSDAYVDVLTVL